MKKCMYPAIFTYDTENNSYIVDFIDLIGCTTEGKTIDEAYEMAQDAMGLYLCDLTDNELPKPSLPPHNNTELKENEFITLVYLDLNEYRKKYNNTAVKKTLTIPMCLNTLAEKNNTNFSQVLQEALKAKLNIN